MTRRTALAIVLMCAAPRLCALWIRPPDSSTLYYQLGADLSARGPAAFATEIGERIDPLYPALLAAARAAAGDHPRAMVLIQIGIAAAAGAVFFALTRSATDSRRTAWIAAALYAASPYLIRQSAAFMEVTLAVALLITIAWMLATHAAAGAAAGTLLAAAVLTRVSFLPIAVGAMLLLARWNRRSAVAATVALVACLGAWTVLARSAGASPFPSRFGENLFVSTSEWTHAVVPRTNVDVLLPLADARAREVLLRGGIADPTIRQRDRAMLGEALAYARSHPWDTAMLKLRNLAYALQPRLLPFTERRGSAEIVDGALVMPPQGSRPLVFEIAAGGFQALILAGGAAGLWKRRYHLGRADAILLVIAGSILAVNVLVFPTSRLLAPMTFVLMFYTAVALGLDVTVQRPVPGCRVSTPGTS